MTREEIAGWAVEQSETWKEQADEEATERGGGTGLAYATAHHAYFDAIAAELRKTCATCQHFRPDFTSPVCTNAAHNSREFVWLEVPADGSGFCHRWEAKP